MGVTPRRFSGWRRSHGFATVIRRPTSISPGAVTRFGPACAFHRLLGPCRSHARRRRSSSATRHDTWAHPREGLDPRPCFSVSRSMVSRPAPAKRIAIEPLIKASDLRDCERHRRSMRDESRAFDRAGRGPPSRGFHQFKVKEPRLREPRAPHASSARAHETLASSWQTNRSRSTVRHTHRSECVLRSRVREDHAP